MTVLPFHVISVLFVVIFNFAVPSNQAKLANVGSDGVSQESNLPHWFESIITKMSTELMKNIETTELMKNIETIRNWDIIKDTDALVSTNEGISSFFVDSNLNGDFTEVKYEIDSLETGKLTVCGQWNLIKTFQNEANTPLITKLALDFFFGYFCSKLQL